MSRRVFEILRWSLAIGLIALVVPAFASAAGGKGKDQIVVTGSVDVPKDRTVHTVVIVDGPATIAGHVTGDVVAVHGKVTLSGQVDGDVSTVTKRARLLPGAHVRHDLLYGDKKPIVDSGATVDGKTKHESWNKVSSSFAWAFGLLIWLGVTLSALILGLLLVALVPRVVEAAWEAAESSLGPVIGIGAGLFVGFPLVALLIAATVFGLPLSLLLFLALLPVYALGYVTAAWLVGRRVLSGPRGRFVPLLVGLLILRVLALIPFLGALVGIAATTLGLGALGIAAWRAGGAGRRAPAPVAPPATS
jgi:cytoskeletal protein CcmA (bactofilin family)